MVSYCCDIRGVSGEIQGDFKGVSWGFRRILGGFNGVSDCRISRRAGNVGWKLNLMEHFDQTGKTTLIRRIDFRETGVSLIHGGPIKSLPGIPWLFRTLFFGGV